MYIGTLDLKRLPDMKAERGGSEITFLSLSRSLSLFQDLHQVYSYIKLVQSCKERSVADSESKES